MTLQISENLALPSRNLSRRQRLARHAPEVRYAIDLVRNRFDEIFQACASSNPKMRLFMGSSVVESGRIGLSVELMQNKFTNFTIASGRIGRWDNIEDKLRRHTELLNPESFHGYETEISDLLEILVVLLQGSAFFTTPKNRHVATMLHTKLTEAGLLQAIEVITIKYGKRAHAISD